MGGHKFILKFYCKSYSGFLKSSVESVMHTNAMLDNQSIFLLFLKFA